MGLSWITPAYLFGLLLLAVPVLIHLVQRTHPSGFRFPSLMFLREIPWREKRRLEIRHWLLMLMRCLLLALIALAFARPFLSADSASLSESGRSDAVIVIDRSYSMRIGDRWQQALERALQQVAEKSAADRLGVIVFGAESEVVSELSENADDLRAVITLQQPGLRGTRLKVAIEQAARLLEGSTAERRSILLISDFQASVDEIPIVDPGIEIETFAVSAENPPNASIDSVSIEAPASGATDEFALVVTLSNHSSTPLEQRLTVNLNGREQPARALLVEPEVEPRIRFEGLPAGTGMIRGSASLDGDALALDNRHYFIYSSQQRIPVLLIEDQQSRTNQNLYLQRALELSRQPLFRIRRGSWESLLDGDLDAWAAIIVNDAAIPGAAAGDALKEFVTAGGGLLVALGESSQASWQAFGGLLPGTLARRVDADPGAAIRIATLAQDHAISAALEEPLDLTAARVYSYRDLEAGADDRILGRFSDGGIALLERRSGAGRVVVMSSTLDAHWNDLALQPVFLPFLHQALRYLSAHEPYSQSFEIGAIVDVLRYARALTGTDAVVAAAGAETLIVEAPSDRNQRLARSRPLLRLEEQGFYEVHRATPANVDVTLAANVDTTESKPQTLDLARFVEEIRASARPSTAFTRRKAAEYEQQQQLWWQLLSAVLLVMLLEAIFANRIAAKRFARGRV